MRAQTPEPPTVVILFDGSGSMWGRLEGERLTKFAMAREALRKELGRLPSETRVGLGSFGHRRAGDCNDAQIIHPPERLDAERIAGTLERLNPRGRGPIGHALREAARSVTGVSGPHSLVLVHDDLDNCQQDVCAVAAEINAVQPRLVINVLSIGLRGEDVSKMACVATTTKGRAYDIQNSAQMAQAVEEVFAGASTVALVKPPERVMREPPRVEPPGTVLPTEQQAAVGPGLRLRALLTAKGEPLARALRWTVTQEDGAGGVVFAALASNPFVNLGAGRYLVEVHDGAFSARQSITLADNAQATVDLVIPAAAVQVRAVAQVGGPPIADAAFAILETPAGQTAGTGRVVAALAGGQSGATLPAGSYIVRAEHGSTRAERRVSLTAGAITPVELVLATARLHLAATAGDGAIPPDQPLFLIYEDDPDAPRGRREITRSSARTPEFVVPAGTYYVVARQGSAESRERLTLAAGETARRTLTIGFGRLQLATRIAGQMQAAREPISYRIERTDVVPPELTVASGANAVVDLAAGRYRIESRYGLMNARATREIEVRPGQALAVSLDHQAGVVQLKHAAAPAEVFWDIRDGSGRTVWSSSQPEPKLVLEAGRYVVIAETKAKRTERPIEVRGGEQRSLLVGD